MRAKPTLVVVSTVSLLLGIMSADASARQVYRAQMLCEGGGHGLGQVHTLILRSGGIAEPFFKVTAKLSALPDLPVTSCQATLACQDLSDVTFDCAQAVEGDELNFSSGPIFMGTLGSPCRAPAVRVEIGYSGDSRSCVTGF